MVPRQMITKHRENTVRQAKSCVDWLDPPDDAHREILESMELVDLRDRVEKETTRVRWIVKSDALRLCQGFIFTPPYLGKHFKAIELTWSMDKHEFSLKPKASLIGACLFGVKKIRKKLTTTKKN